MNGLIICEVFNTEIWSYLYIRWEWTTQERLREKRWSRLEKNTKQQQDEEVMLSSFNNSLVRSLLAGWSLVCLVVWSVWWLFSCCLGSVRNITDTILYHTMSVWSLSDDTWCFFFCFSFDRSVHLFNTKCNWRFFFSSLLDDVVHRCFTFTMMMLKW